MEALDVVHHVLHKNITQEIAIVIRRGPKGYGTLLKLRLLLYGTLQEFFSTRKLVKHLRKRSEVLKKLGFETLPDKRTIDRWKRSMTYELEQVVLLTGNKYLQLNESQWLLLDSTPLPDENDPEATVGHTSKGPFKGFKLHMSCDEYEVPIRATVTHANVHDSQEASRLLAPRENTGADSAYDSKEIKNAIRAMGSKPFIVHNPRRAGKAAKRKSPKILRKMRVCIEQCNGFIKNEVMEYAWILMKGIAAKTVFALTAVLAIQGLALYSLHAWNYPSIRIQEVRI